MLELVCEDGVSVTARLELVQERPLLFHGASVGLGNRLYLMEVLALDDLVPQFPASPLLPAVLVNTVPKSGTYFLQRVFQELGFRPTDLHLGNASLHDNRGIPRDGRIHRRPREREIPLAVGLLPPYLAPGSVTVGHIDDHAVLEAFLRAGVCLIPVVRDLRAILWSLFRFKLAAVEPLDELDRHWRACASPVERFMGFLTYQLDHDIIHIVNCFRSFAQLVDVPVLRYEDLVAGSLPQPAATRLAQRLQGCGGMPAFLTALASARHAPTPTLSRALPALPVFSAEEEAVIRRLIDAAVAGSGLAEVNALFGYGPACSAADPPGRPTD